MFLGLPQQTTSNGGDPYGNTKKTELAWYVQDDWKVTPYLTLNYGLRWDWYGRITESIDKQSIWDLDCNCMLIAGQDTQRGLVDDDWNNFAPRFGFALRPFADDSTVIRAGGGISYDNEMRHNFSFVTNPPFFEQTRFNRGPGTTLTMDDPFQANATAPPTPFGIRFGMPKKFRDTYAEHWNLSVQREVLSNTVLDVSYVGNHVVKAQRLRNLNQFVLGGGPPFAGPFFSLMLEQGGSSTYHALQVRGERRFSDGLAFISSYTWGHAIDDRNGEGDASTGPLGIPGVQNAHDVSQEKASTDYDVRHRYTLSYLYDLPSPNYEGLAGHILNGWGTSGVLTLQSGRAFTVYQPGPFGVSGTFGFGDRPNVVPGTNPVPSNQGPDGWINPAAFAIPTPGTFGDVGRNTLRGPALKNMDLSIAKTFQINEDRAIQFRTELFNLTNHVNLGLPNQQFGLPDFGEIGTTVTRQRQIQIGLRYEF